ncbi:MAG: beta-lactamase family protein [Gemmataceae bacterium]|nr:beta-lactamase family protein [Gemmataceae bacterium]
MTPLLLLLAFAAGPEIDKTRLDALRERFQKFIDAGDIPGAVLALGTKDSVHIEAVGKRSLEPAADMEKDTPFRIASMTKPIVGAAIQLLIEDGRLAATDPVEKHLPEFKGQMVVSERGEDTLTLRKPKRPITVRDLLTHTSGLSAYPPGFGDFYMGRDRSLAEAALAVSQRPLDFEPGTKWAYCNSGIDTLGRIVEKVSGKPFEAFMQERIFDPLGMKDTSFHPTEEQLKRTASLYSKEKGRLVLAKDTLLGPPGKGKHPIPAGGLYSTAADVSRFYQAMLGGKAKLLKQESIKEMTTVHTGDLKAGFTSSMGFGYAFAVVRKPEGATEHLSAGSFGHGGAFGTQSWADPEKGHFVVLMIQRTGLPNADASEMRKELQRLAVEALKK